MTALDGKRLLKAQRRFIQVLNVRSLSPFHNLYVSMELFYCADCCPLQIEEHSRSKEFHSTCEVTQTSVCSSKKHDQTISQTISQTNIEIFSKNVGADFVTGNDYRALAKMEETDKGKQRGLS